MREDIGDYTRGVALDIVVFAIDAFSERWMTDRSGILSYPTLPCISQVETIGLLNGLGTNVVNEQLQVETPPQQSASSINTEYTVIISTLLLLLEDLVPCQCIGNTIHKTMLGSTT